MSHVKDLTSSHASHTFSPVHQKQFNARTLFLYDLGCKQGDAQRVSVGHSLRLACVFFVFYFSGPPKFHNRPSRGNIISRRTARLEYNF